MTKKLYTSFFLFSLLCLLGSFIMRPKLNNPSISKDSSNHADKILGYWTTPERDLTVFVYPDNGNYAARVTGFKCTCKKKTSQESHVDIHNPNPKLRNNSWIDTKVLWGLYYEGDNKWVGGIIYDLGSGSKYSSYVKMTGDEIEVRGYWGFEFLGQSIKMVRP
ncbi:MAG: hypothetical protein ACI9XP_001761 [Lentimonas sp.]|jgi:uncharacterized protein (DUF2147 family)